MNKSTGWIVAIVGLVVALGGVYIRGTHHTIGLATIALGVVVLIVGVVLALRGGGGSKATPAS